ncbi:MAG: hypothetical protein ACLR2E_06240 [Lachnospiraceae bacterium]
MPKALHEVESAGLKSVLSALEHPEKTVWTNIFAPVELLQCFGLSSISMECLSSFFRLHGGGLLYRPG